MNISHREKRVQAGAELRTALLEWLEQHATELSDVEIAGIIQAQAHSLADQFMHARILEEDTQRAKDNEQRHAGPNS
jgi:hypothetical protein